MIVVCYSRNVVLCLKKFFSKPKPPPLVFRQRSPPGDCGGLTERQIKDGSRESLGPSSPARGSGASLSVSVSARSNSRIPYLEARGSCYCQENQIIPK